jgi:hypothetical protein
VLKSRSGKFAIRGIVRSITSQAALLLAAAGLTLASGLTLAGCATVGNEPALPATSMQTLEYYPFQVKGYQNSYPHRSILILMPVEARDMSDAGTTDTAPLNGNPEVGVTLNKNGGVAQHLYSSPLGTILRGAIGRSAEEAGLTASTSDDTAYKPGVTNPNEYVLASKITRCWVKKTQGADGQYGPVMRTVADFRIDVTIYKPPFSVPFWNGTTSDTYYDPPVGSFGLGPEDEAGIYDEPGQVLSVAMTRSVAQIFERSDLRNLMLEDEVKTH